MRTNKSFAILRIVFGFVWLIDAFFKWNSGFIDNFTNYLTNSAQGQPALVQTWIHLWVQVVNINPHFFAIVVAISETAITFSLLFGLFTRAAIVGGIILSLLIWTTAEGFGGPYAAGSTDIGSAIIYALLFFALWFGKSWEFYSLDGLLAKRKG